MTDTFKALVLEQEEGRTRAEFRELTEDQLPEDEVLVDVEYSSLNYKDGLAVTGRGKIARQFPLVPGIDLAGTVVASESSAVRPGDRVIATGWGMGESHWGGYAQRARVPADWLVPLPAGLDTRRAMAIGTAGFTAMLCVMALEDGGLTHDLGTVLVTGAGGGVGSVAVAVLAARGYRVAAVTGRTDTHAYLHGLGAAEIVDRKEMQEPPRPLESQRWSGAVDTVGGTMLARVLAETRYGGTVAACGLAGGHDLPATVMPFILRAVRLQGVDSVYCPPHRRRAAWERLARELPADTLDLITSEVPLTAVTEAAEAILEGRTRGRVVVNVSA